MGAELGVRSGLLSTLLALDPGAFKAEGGDDIHRASWAKHFRCSGRPPARRTENQVGGPKPLGIGPLPAVWPLAG